MFPPCKSVLYGAPLATGRELRSDCYSEPAAIIGEERRGKASPEREIRTPRLRRVGHAAERLIAPQDVVLAVAVKVEAQVRRRVRAAADGEYHRGRANPSAKTLENVRRSREYRTRVSWTLGYLAMIRMDVQTVVGR